MKLKEAYNSATSLFNGITTPTSDYTNEIKDLVYARWRNNDLVNVETEDDLTEWREWFQFITLTSWDVADKLLTSAALITDPLKTFARTSTTEGTNSGETRSTNTGSGSTTTSGSSSDTTQTDSEVILDRDTTAGNTNTISGEVETSGSKTGSITDTLKIETDGESADATSGYNNATTEATGSNTNSAVTTLEKVSDTPQSAVANLTAGYLSQVKETTVTPAGANTTESDSTTESNYLDASSHNKSETIQHSGGQSTSETDSATTEESRTTTDAGTGTEDATTTEDTTVTSSGTTSGTSSSTDTRTITGAESYEDEHTTTESGYTVSQAELVKQYRETILNVRREVADLWHECFILMYGFCV